MIEEYLATLRQAFWPSSVSTKPVEVIQEVEEELQNQVQTEKPSKDLKKKNKNKKSGSTTVTSKAPIHVHYKSPGSMFLSEKKFKEHAMKELGVKGYCQMKESKQPELDQFKVQVDEAFADDSRRTLSETPFSARLKEFEHVSVDELKQQIKFSLTKSWRDDAAASWQEMRNITGANLSSSRYWNEEEEEKERQPSTRRPKTKKPTHQQDKPISTKRHRVLSHKPAQRETQTKQMYSDLQKLIESNQARPEDLDDSEIAQHLGIKSGVRKIQSVIDQKTLDAFSITTTKEKQSPEGIQAALEEGDYKNAYLKWRATIAMPSPRANSINVSFDVDETNDTKKQQQQNTTTAVDSNEILAQLYRLRAQYKNATES